MLQNFRILKKTQYLETDITQTFLNYFKNTGKATVYFRYYYAISFVSNNKNAEHVNSDTIYFLLR